MLIFESLMAPESYRMLLTGNGHLPDPTHAPPSSPEAPSSLDKECHPGATLSLDADGIGRSGDLLLRYSSIRLA